MKKKDVINLIRFYIEHNDKGFRNEAYSIATEFDQNGDNELSEYIVSLLSDNNVFVPQSIEENNEFLEKVNYNEDPLPLPTAIKNDVLNIVNAISNPRLGVNKFLFYGNPGTGKTESVKQISRITDKLLYSVNFDYIIDSHLGETSKNISKLFSEINAITNPNKVLILFDEIDAIALNRIDQQDVREMGRAVSSVLKGLDQLNEKITLVATTNLYDELDKALLRRFDKVVDFNRYEKKDLIDIADILLDYYLKGAIESSKDKRLFDKILNNMQQIPFPGELKNIIRTSIAFSKPTNKYDYLRNLYKSCFNKEPNDVEKLRSEGFTLREIETLTGVSRSTASREMRGVK
jgi:SpoVK/Ycf46/Vps4 family AAA+-type ATPase